MFAQIRCFPNYCVKGHVGHGDIAFSGYDSLQISLTSVLPLSSTVALSPNSGDFSNKFTSEHAFFDECVYQSIGL
mgnify:CR=1 FL=1|jgi:hypothetical protein